MSMMGGLSTWNIVTLLLLAAYIVAVGVQVFRKAGYPGWMGVLMIVPVVNLIAITWFAFFAQWPTKR